MRQEDPVKLNEPFKLDEGSEIFLVYSPDCPKHYMRHVFSSGHPMVMLELHSRDSRQVLATVFSYTMGKRFMIVFDENDIRQITAAPAASASEE